MHVMFRHIILNRRGKEVIKKIDNDATNEGNYMDTPR